jgi:hypothetical protein
MKLLPVLHDRIFKFITTKEANVPAEAVAMIKEVEGNTLIIPVAEEEGEVFAWISLVNETLLTATGITAKFSEALSEAGIACNVLAGFHHDHILVPYDKRNQAIEIIAAVEV